jgi:flagellar hook-associated protein 2
LPFCNGGELASQTTKAAKRKDSMGAVGINFGAATSGAGFDVASTVSSIVANLKAVETPWNTQLTALKAQDTAFTSMGTDLATLSTSLQALTDFEGIFASKQGSSSDTNLLALSSAGPTAVAGSHTVVVSQLAQTSSEYTDAVPTTDTLSGSLTIQVGPSGTPQTIPVVSGASDTLSTYAAAINAAGIGVSASIISDTTGSRLSLVSNTSGTGGQLTVTGALTDATANTAVALHTGLSGKDAQLTVDGIAVDSASNTISTAIPGVTFQLLDADPKTSIQILIANDNTNVESTFSNFVSAYNTVVKDIKTQEGNDSSGNPEPLYGNPIVSQIQTGLSLALTSGAVSGGVSNLSQLGISVNDDGTLTLDSSTLDAQLNSNYSDVVGFLQNAGSFGQSFSTVLDQLGNSTPSGALTLALSSNSLQETTLNDNVTKQDALIATQQTRLTAELNLANETLQGIPQQLNEVNELYSAMTGYNNNTTG